MRTVLFKTVQALESIHTVSVSKFLICRRKVSTNSAIARGIRRSRTGPATEWHGNPRNGAEYGSFNKERRERPGYLREEPQARESSREPRSRYSPSRSRFGDGGGRFNRDEGQVTKRPNHQQRQDYQDIEQSRLLSNKKRTPRQERYLRGGLIGTPSSSRPTYGSFERPDRLSERSRRLPYSNDEHKRPYYDKREQPGLSRGFGRKLPPPSWQSSSNSMSAGKEDASPARRNREQRRAERFGPPSFRREDANDAYRKPEYSERKSPLRARASDPELFEERREARSAWKPCGEISPMEDDPLPAKVDMSYKEKPIWSIPYTTPASEFLYGTSVVLAALKSTRRKLYKLYMYSGDHREAQNMDGAIKKVAHAREVEVFDIKTESLGLMDKMSGGRPHNGYVLEASPLPKLPATELVHVDKPNGPLEVTLDYQSREEELVNGTDPVINYKTAFPRYPFVLMLDGILDPGNLGAILRTAQFLSVDALAMSTRHSAPLTPTALKASAGASETLPLISIPHPGAFIDASKPAGWKFYAAVAPPSALPSPPLVPKPNHVGSKASLEGKATYAGPLPPHYTLSELARRTPLGEGPCVLMLGSEGEGLRWNMQKKADATVSIEGGWRLEEGEGSGLGRVDSLNVSVAAGLLCEGFLRRPAAVEDGGSGGREEAFVVGGVKGQSDLF